MGQLYSKPGLRYGFNTDVSQILDSNPIYRVPNEVWETIAENVSSSKDLISLTKVIPVCEKILYPTRVKWLFDQVIPLVVDELILLKKDLYNCRLVCKRWCYGVDQFLENNAIQRPASGEDETELNKKLNLRHYFLERFYTTEDLHYRINLKKLTKEKLLEEAIEHPRNPIVGRCVDIRHPHVRGLSKQVFESVEENSVDIKYLQNFGSQIYFLQLYIHEGGHLNYLKRLVEFFSLVSLPNLKKLEIKEHSVWAGQQRGTECKQFTEVDELHKYIKDLTDEQKSSFPKNLETLNIGKTDEYTYMPMKRILFDLFCSENTKSLNVNIYRFPIGINLPNLVHLSIWITTDAAIEGLLGLNSPIRRLCIQVSMDDRVNTLSLFHAINHFRNTLTYLELYFDEIDEYEDLFYIPNTIDFKPFHSLGSLILPKIKTFKIKCCRPPSYNFMSGLRSLEYIYLEFTLESTWEFILKDRAEKNVCSEILDIKYYLDKVCGHGEEKMKQPKMYDSNIWKVFTRLKIFDVFVCHKAHSVSGTRAMGCDYLRNFYEMLQENEKKSCNIAV